MTTKQKAVREDVETIRQKYDHYGDTDRLNNNTAVLHIRTLLEEIDRLKAVQSYASMIEFT